MRTQTRLRGVFALLSVLVAAIALAACGSSDDTATDASSSDTIGRAATT